MQCRDLSVPSKLDSVDLVDAVQLGWEGKVAAWLISDVVQFGWVWEAAAWLISYGIEQVPLDTHMRRNGKSYRLTSSDCLHFF